MAATMTITELHQHVERKFTGGYRCVAVLTAWDSELETATYRLTFHAGGHHVAKLDAVIYAQGWQSDAKPEWRGVATYTHKPTERQQVGYVHVVTTEG